MTAEPTHATPRQQPLLLTLVVATAMFMEMFDGTVILTALPAMARDFDTSLVNMSLGITAYMLSTAIVLPASGWLADRHGCLKVFCIATLVFIGSSVWCGLSTTLPGFVAARTVQGIGAALMSPVGRLLVLRATPKDQLVRVINLMIVPALIGPVLGPPIGGMITTYASWHWCFFINVPIGLLVLYFMLTHSRNEPSTDAKPFDVQGFVLNGASLSCLIYGLDQINEHWPGSMGSYALTGTGIVLGWLALRHARGAPSPLVDLRAASLYSFRLSMLTGGGLYRLLVSAPMFLLPLMFQVGLGLSAFEAGLLMLSHPMGDLVAKAFTNRFIQTLGFRRGLISTALAFALLLGCCSLFTTATSHTVIVMVLALLGVARSLQMSALNSLQYAEVDQNTMTDASTLSNVLQQVQRSFGIALAAMTLNLAAAWYGTDHHHLGLIDFQLAVSLMAALAAMVLLWYWRMPANTGHQLMQRSR